MDELEKYIKENKHLLNEQKADKEKLWQNIEPRLEKSKTKYLWGLSGLKIAATILIVVGMFSMITLFLIPGSNHNTQNTIVHQELKDINNYYENLVSFQVQLIQSNTQLQAKDKEKFLSFMDDLDKEYNILRLEMTKNLNNEYILEAIVNNYKKRIELIENLLEQINDSKKSTDNEDYIL